MAFSYVLRFAENCGKVKLTSCKTDEKALAYETKKPLRRRLFVTRNINYKNKTKLRVYSIKIPTVFNQHYIVSIFNQIIRTRAHLLFI